ncbi:MAG: hypothetical protein ACPGXL_08025 [Chitinophagales bacterium]
MMSLFRILIIVLLFGVNGICFAINSGGMGTPATTKQLHLNLIATMTGQDYYPSYVLQNPDELAANDGIPTIRITQPQEKMVERLLQMKTSDTVNYQIMPIAEQGRVIYFNHIPTDTAILLILEDSFQKNIGVSGILVQDRTVFSLVFDNVSPQTNTYVEASSKRRRNNAAKNKRRLKSKTRTKANRIRHGTSMDLPEPMNHSTETEVVLYNRKAQKIEPQVLIGTKRPQNKTGRPNNATTPKDSLTKLNVIAKVDQGKTTHILQDPTLAKNVEGTPTVMIVTGDEVGIEDLLTMPVEETVNYKIDLTGEIGEAACFSKTPTDTAVLLVLNENLQGNKGPKRILVKDSMLLHMFMNETSLLSMDDVVIEVETGIDLNHEKAKTHQQSKVEQLEYTKHLLFKPKPVASHFGSTESEQIVQNILRNNVVQPELFNAPGAQNLVPYKEQKYATFGAYQLVLSEIQSRKKHYAIRYHNAVSFTEKQAVLENAAVDLEQAILKEVITFWYNTSFTKKEMTRKNRNTSFFSSPSTTDMTGVEFVHTIMRQADLPISTNKSKRGYDLINELCAPQLVSAFDDVPAVEQFINTQGEGLYILAFENHLAFVGFINQNISIIHSTREAPHKVVRLPIKGAKIFNTPGPYHIGKLEHNTELMKRWLLGERNDSAVSR